MIRKLAGKLPQNVVRPLKRVLRFGEYLVFHLYQKPGFLIWRRFNRNKAVELACITPFEDFEITKNGDCFICCPAWLPVPVGNINDSDPESIFNSVAAQKVRISMYRGTFKYCDKTKCTRLLSKSSKTMSSREILALNELNQEAKNRISHRNLFIPTPSRITEAVSEVCNIRCKFCWTPYGTSKLNQEALKFFVSYVNTKIDSIKMISFCGGEPFVQKHVKEILRACHGKDVMFYVTSNLNSLDDELKRLIGSVRLYVLHVSVNAASEQAYNATVDGGNWHKVLENLDYLVDLRRKGAIRTWLQISMVVTTTNYRDIAEFARFGIERGVDRIIYYGMNDYGIPAQSALKLKDEEREQVRELLRDPVFAEHRDIIELGALTLDGTEQT